MARGKKMRIAITGSTGLVGSALVRALELRGDQVLRLVRRETRYEDEVRWSPENGVEAPEGLEGIDACIHLAGESIADRRWSAAQKERIRNSRVLGTQVLVKALNALEQPPKALLSASAVGYYGDRGEERLPETARRGEGFLPEVCAAWEEAAEGFRGRVALMRIGVILSTEGGALQKMLPPFRMGVGGRLGSGRQSFPWITLQDSIAAFLHTLDHDSLSGPINVTAPAETDNEAFTKALGRVLRRPTIFPMPAFAARLAFGEMADELLLASTKVFPERLLDSGFRFAHPDIEHGLLVQLGNASASAKAPQTNSAT